MFLSVLLYFKYCCIILVHTHILMKTSGIGRPEIISPKPGEGKEEENPLHPAVTDPRDNTREALSKIVPLQH